MKSTKLSAALACALSAFCAAVPVSHAADVSLSELNELSELRIEPVMTVRHSDEGAESLYRLGRHHQQADRLEEAADAYRAALDKDANHIEARNALATIYFAQKNMIAAMAEFKTILQQQPELSHVRSNLGYALLQEGNVSAAMPELAQAIMADPTNARAFGNLTLAYERLGAIVKEGSARTAQPAAVPEADTMAAAAAAPQAAPDGDAAAATTPTAQAAPASEPDMKAETAAAAMSTAMGATAAEPEANPAADARAAMQIEPAATTLAALEPGSGIAVVIANGTRDESMAGRIADGLRRNGVHVSRMTGLAPYTQQRTVILYRDGYRKQAVALSRLFVAPPAVVNNTRTRDAADQSTVRLVLGKRSAQADIRMAAMQIAAAR